MYDNKRKLIGALIIAALMFSLFTVYIYANPKPEARAAALYEPETETFLYEKSYNEHLPMASTTKILTALLALENLPPDKMITVPAEATGIEGSSVYLEKGEIISAKDLIYSTILGSANDAAATLAIEISGSCEAFSHLMNERAAALGLYDTEFKNPHGLDAEGHYTSAHDLAKIAAEALSNEEFKTISSTYKYSFETPTKARTLVNHNKLLKRIDGCVGVKTGYTQKSGRSLVSAVERDGLLLIAVTIDAPNDWKDHERMHEYGFSLLRADVLAYPCQYSYNLPVIGGEAESAKVSNTDGKKLIVDKNAAPYQAEVQLDRFLVAPVKKGDAVGRVVFKRDGEVIAEIKIFATEDVNIKEKKGLFSFFGKDK